ncbi:MAG: hypothetical protein ACQEW0_16240 [Pseudomonadota bacterium]
MSMHKTPLTELERAGLEAHGLPTGKPSQLSDCFRSGVAWANARIAELEAQVEQHKAAEEMQIALREKADEREAALAAQFVALQDAATDLIHASNEDEAGDAMERIAECSEKQARELLGRRDKLNKAEALEDAAKLYAHPWKEEFSVVAVDLMRKGRGYIHPEGLLDYAEELRQQADQC